MPVTGDSPAPYAPASALVDIIGRYRSRGLPMPVTAEVLGRAGISDSLIPRTMQALKTLDLIDETGNATQVMEGLRLAPEGEYKQRFGQWLNEAYADVLNYVDPATATETQLRDAFRHYNPVGQQPRMMSLFAGLYREAGIGSDTVKAPRAARRAKAAAPGNGAAKPVKQPPVVTPPGAAVVPPKPATTEISDKALEYKLVDLLKDDGIGPEQQAAIWTLIQYLTAKAKAKADPA